MERFKKIPSKIGDLVRKDRLALKPSILQQQSQQLITEKHFIKRNMRTVQEISKDTHKQRVCEEKTKWRNVKREQEAKGAIPKYLETFKFL